MRPTLATIDLGAIARNYRRIAERVGGGRALFCVVKGDAYGHGAAAVARRLAAEGATRFAVAIAEEGVALRRAGIRGEILLLNFSDPADAGVHRAYGLVPTLHDFDQAHGFAAATRDFGPALAVHVKVDTGMGRIGFRPEELPALVELLGRSAGLAVAGTFTNLASAEDPASRQTARQVETMAAFVGALSAAAVSPGLVHVANSAGVLFHEVGRFDGARPGLALY
ncbi:MAG TPA: alanine racemase, partial [Thermoanaerobaculia bacterium]|nr:alanine racemase [Thermoanaerobaculia bacterium]